MMSMLPPDAARAWLYDVSVPSLARSLAWFVVKLEWILYRNVVLPTRKATSAVLLF